jgi:hypothetical protein
MEEEIMKRQEEWRQEEWRQEEIMKRQEEIMKRQEMREVNNYKIVLMFV